MSKIYRNTSTPEGKAFWELSSRAAEVATWPDWKRAGINVTDSTRSNEERSTTSGRSDRSSR